MLAGPSLLLRQCPLLLREWSLSLREWSLLLREWSLSLDHRTSNLRPSADQRYLYPQIQQILAEKPCAARFFLQCCLGRSLPSRCFSHGFKTLELIAGTSRRPFLGWSMVCATQLCRIRTANPSTSAVRAAGMRCLALARGIGALQSIHSPTRFGSGVSRTKW